MKVLGCDKSGDRTLEITARSRRRMLEAAAHNHNGGNDLKNIIDCYKILVAGRGDLSIIFFYLNTKM